MRACRPVSLCTPNDTSYHRLPQSNKRWAYVTIFDRAPGQAAAAAAASIVLVYSIFVRRTYIDGQCLKRYVIFASRVAGKVTMTTAHHLQPVLLRTYVNCEEGQNMWPDTVPTAKLTFRIGQGQL